jgi:Na+-driven multidrug efflux pump
MGASGMWLGFIAGLTMASLLLIARFLKMTKPQ